jgi:hypothetical protein
MSVIDINGVLTFFDLTAKAPGGGSNTVGEHLSFERKARRGAGGGRRSHTRASLDTACLGVWDTYACSPAACAIATWSPCDRPRVRVRVRVCVCGGGGAAQDAWDMRWADDNPELFAMMEKTRMYIFRGLDPEEPVTSSAYLCSFHDLEISAAFLDDVMQQPDQPDLEFMVMYETRSLR